MWDPVFAEYHEPRRRAFYDALSKRIREKGFTNETFAEQLVTEPAVISEIRSGYLELPISWITVVAANLDLDSRKLMEEALSIFLPTVIFSAAEAMTNSISSEEFAIVELIRAYNGRQTPPLSDGDLLDKIERAFKPGRKTPK